MGVCYAWGMRKSPQERRLAEAVAALAATITEIALHRLDFAGGFSSLVPDGGDDPGADKALAGVEMRAWLGRDGAGVREGRRDWNKDEHDNRNNSAATPGPCVGAIPWRLSWLASRPGSPRADAELVERLWLRVE